MYLSWVGPGAARRLALCCLAAVGLAAVGLTACGPPAGSAPDVQGRAATHPPSAPGKSYDWRDGTYTLTCDGVVPDGFEARLRKGAARVPADAAQPPHYDYYDVHYEAQASGDVDGDGAPDTVVLLQCSPQPSNGIVEEVQVFAADGSRLGELPSPTTLRESTILAPLYDPTGLSVRDGDIVAAMKAYGPDDNHAEGPSQHITVRWHWDGQSFVRVP
jgi:hypothetical protein